MSGVSTASVAMPAGFGALLGGVPEGDGFGGPTAKASSSFGAALALAERMLDTGARMTTPTDAEIVAPSEITTSANSDLAAPIEEAVPIEEEEEHGIADVDLPAAAADLEAPPIAPLAETVSHPVTAEDGIGEDAQVASHARVTVTSPVTDADASILTVVLASAASPANAANTRTGDTPPVVTVPAVAAVPSAASAAPVAHTETAPAMSPGASVASDTHPVALAPAAAPKDADARPDQPAPPTPTPAAPAPAVSAAPTSTLVASAPVAASPTSRAIVAQVAPAVLSIVQRPVGSHQLTMTVNPDTLGPVTVRAHISAAGEVRVELLGATDAGREALRTVVTDLRRDLAAVMPHASLTLASHAAADTGSPDRGTQPGGAGATGEHASGERGRAPSDGRSTAESQPRGIPRILPIPTRAVSGEGLDIFA